MRFSDIPIVGAKLIHLDRHEDERGYFARTWCRSEFARAGLAPALAQCSVAYNRRRGTLRGMHFQAPPVAETKVVRCTRGAIYDVLVDVREGSPSYLLWHGEVLSESGDALYIPEGCAHGYLTLADETEIFYQVSVEYEPALFRGFRWDDPRVGIVWPAAPVVVSDRDARLPAFIGR